MLESNVTAILGECLSCRIWSENHQRLPLPSASVGCRDFTIMPNIMVRPRLRENRMCVSGRTFDGVHMRSSLLCQSVRSGRDCEHRSNDSSFSGPGLRVSEPLRTYTVNGKVPLKFWIEPVTFLTSTTSPVFKPWVCEVVTEAVLLFRETDAICTLPTRTPAGRGLDDSKTMHWLPL